MARNSAPPAAPLAGLETQLLDAALALLEEGGPDGLSLRGVARRAGVSHNAPYNHFDAKGALLAALADRGFAALERSMADAEAVAPRRAADRLVACALGFVMFAQRHPHWFALMFQPEHAAGAQSATAVGSAMARLTAAVAAVTPSGTAQDAQLVWVHLHGLSCWLLAAAPHQSNPLETARWHCRRLVALLAGAHSGA